MSIKLILVIAISVLCAITISSASNGENTGQDMNAASHSNNVDRSDPLDAMGFLLDIAGLFAPEGATIGKFIDGVTTGMDAAKGELVQVIDDLLMIIPGTPKIIKPGDDFFNPILPNQGVKPASV